MTQQKLLFATRNRGKLTELRELLAAFRVELLSLDDLDTDVIAEETGATFVENATIKARIAAEATGLPTLADDSGLEVDALDGRPGVRSARYAGDNATDAQRIEKLLGELSGTEQQKRTARFRCAIAHVNPADLDTVDLAEGSCEGHITEKSHGSGGFGYDPVFFSTDLGRTFAEAGAEEKNRVSHRGHAMRRMAEILRDKLHAR